MKSVATILLLFCIFCTSCQKSYNLKGNWKNCGDSPGLSDALVFNDSYNFVRNDTVFLRKDSAIAIIERISFEYGEKKLYVKSLADYKIYRFCKK
ncbi:hypothetical protein [Chryseobacterium terrae]|uniref:Uncharacterized protein n=1 Tax=Chryseobacterium terrae TaxID=3163299 RepID=A0ABW8Y215_9FLAO